MCGRTIRAMMFIMSVRSESITNLILEILGDLGRMAPRPFDGKSGWSKRLRNFHKPQFERAVRHLDDRGLIKIISKNSQRFIQITKAGQIQTLLKKAKIVKTSKNPAWDNKWRLVIFDIPEDSKAKRNLLRFLLRRQGFRKLQASVYINPHPLNREAVAYLNESELIEFIRILRVDEFDNDRKIRQMFQLN